MSISYSDAVSTVADWLATARVEIRRLAQDAADLAGTWRDQWQHSPEFRARVFREVLHGLAAAVLRGPRAAVLWAVAAIGELIITLASMLDEQGPHPRPLY